MVYHGAHRVRCQDSTAASTQNYHYNDGEDNFFPCAGSRGCQNGSSTSRGVVRPLVVVLRQFAVGITRMRMRTSRHSDRRSRPGVLRDPIWRNVGSSQMTATTEQVPIGTHWWRASGSLPAVLCDGFNQWKGGEGFAQLPQRHRLDRLLRVDCGVSLLFGRGVNSSPPVWVGLLPMGVDAARLKIKFCYYSFQS